MILHIDTTQGHEILLAIKDGKKIIAQKKFLAQYSQAEKLLPAIDKLLRGKKIKLSEIKKIIVANQGGGFTALRIGVVTANTLGYALGIPAAEAKRGCQGLKEVVRGCRFNIIKPVYSKEPNITIKKHEIVD